MANQTVRVFTVDEDTDALAGVLVQVYDETGTSFITQNTTSIVGSDAYCEFTLDGDDPPNIYTIRMSKTGVAFDGSLGDDSKTPQYIEVYTPETASPSGTNDFTVQGQTFSLPVATDPNLCRCSGFFLDPTGQPLPNLNVKFMATFSPILVDSYAIMGRHVEIETDSDGYMEVDLFRTGEYEVVIESFEDVNRNVVVPDASSASLTKMLFLTVAGVTFDPDPVSIAVDAYEDVILTITDSLGGVLDPLDGDLLFASSDSDVASIQLLDTGELRIMGVAVGTAQVTAERADTSIVTIPESFVYTPLDVTVT